MLSTHPATAQEARDSISGRVTDHQGAVIAGATVTVTNTETNAVARTRSNETGYFEATLLNPGQYSVAVEAPGFKRSVRSGLDLNVAGRRELAFHLEVGSVTESVEVRAAAPLLDTTTTSGGRVMDSRQILQLPLGTLSFTVLPAPGATPAANPGGVVNGATFARGTSVAPGSLVSLFGSNLAAANAAAGATPLPATLGGTGVRVNGDIAPLFFASPNQINLQIPWEAGAASPALIAVSVGAVAGLRRRSAWPHMRRGSFRQPAGHRPGGDPHRRHWGIGRPNGQYPRPSLTPCPGPERSILCTGLGPVNDQPLTGEPAPADPLVTTITPPTIGGALATVLFSGLAPGFVGLYQLNVLVPQSIPPGDALPVVATIGGVNSNSVTIAKQ